ncbi:hypothetical protein DAI22_02g175700 [Oryza sativa Japonica Group]|nr:hypothetical protein DAI22_02g175700 [Oryza sativa Japonica Group]
MTEQETTPVRVQLQHCGSVLIGVLCNHDSSRACFLLALLLSMPLAWSQRAVHAHHRDMDFQAFTYLTASAPSLLHFRPTPLMTHAISL